jgi:hypothetical protein
MIMQFLHSSVYTLAFFIAYITIGRGGINWTDALKECEGHPTAVLYTAQSVSLRPVMLFSLLLMVPSSHAAIRMSCTVTSHRNGIIRLE